ncbi:hypothetical protein [Lactobacillus gallinarum]|uniref:hypothetical protein n=1 Tax=Lactobacillus gallinarum TaxID=52242 RepID=UPI001179FC3E|nr:hypothetical protein [Lactobacillus gallinarum]
MLAGEHYKALFDDLALLLSFKATESTTEAPDETEQKARYDRILDFTLRKVLKDVSNYCNIPVDELPGELDETIVALSAQVINTHQWLTPLEDQNNNVASLNEGDTSVSFKDPSEVYATLQSVNTLTDNYLAILNNFRKVKW